MERVTLQAKNWEMYLHNNQKNIKQYFLNKYVSEKDNISNMEKKCWSEYRFR